MRKLRFDLVNYSLPDLTLSDYFLWGHVKDIVYHDLPGTIQELQDKLTLAARNVEEYTLKNIHKNIEYRLCFGLKGEGGHFEPPMN